MEQQTFHTLYEDEKNIKNAVKDNLSGLYVETVNRFHSSSER